MLLFLAGAIILLLIYEQPRILGSAAGHWWGRLILIVAALACAVAHPCLGALAAVLYVVSVDLVPWGALNQPSGPPEQSEAEAERDTGAAPARHTGLGRIDAEALVQGRVPTDVPPAPVSQISLSGSANEFKTVMPLGTTKPAPLPAAA